MTIYESPTPELIEKYNQLGYYPKPDDFEPSPTYPEGHAWHGRPRCQAWEPNKGRQCMRIQMVSVGVNKCSRHGGKALRGSQSPKFKTGRYSKVLPARLAARYSELVKDDDIMSMKSRVELLETRVVEIVSHIDDQGAYELFKKLKDQMTEYKEVMRLSKTATSEEREELSRRATKALQEIDRLINTGIGEWANWKEIQSLTESIRRLADTEQKQIKTAETAVMLDRILIFASAMASIFRDALMASSGIPVKTRRDILSKVESEINLVLKQGEYTQVIDG